MDETSSISSLASVVSKLDNRGFDIFQFLSVRDVNVFSMVCEYFRNIVWGDDDVLWMNLVLRDLYLMQNTGLNVISVFVNLKESLGIVNASTFYYVFKSYHLFHKDLMDIPSPKVNLFNFIGHWRSMPQSFTLQHYRGGLMHFCLDFNEETPRVLLQFINVYKIVYRTFWVHYYDGELVAVSINSYDTKTYSLKILPSYFSTQFNGNEQVNMPSVTIILTNNTTVEVEHVLTQIYKCDVTQSVIPQGLYSASYGKHGLELLLVYHDEITSSTKALKIIGDENVPAGKLSFIIINTEDELANMLVYDPRPTYASYLIPRDELITDGAFMHNLPPSIDDHRLYYAEKSILARSKDAIAKCYQGNGNTNDEPFIWLNKWVPLTLVVYGPHEPHENHAAFSIIWEDSGYSHRHYMDCKPF
jgi:hypothetical protein